MLQPTKDVLREQLVLAAEEIIRLRGKYEVPLVSAEEAEISREAWAAWDAHFAAFAMRRRWWHRFAWWRK